MVSPGEGLATWKVIVEAPDVAAVVVVLGCVVVVVVLGCVVVVVVDGVVVVVVDVTAPAEPAMHISVGVADGGVAKALLTSSPTAIGTEMTLSAPLNDEWA